MSAGKITFGVLLVLIGLFCVGLASVSGLMDSASLVSFPLDSTTSIEPHLSGLLKKDFEKAFANVSLSITSGSRIAPGTAILYDINVTLLALAPGPFSFTYEIVNANTNQSFLRKDEKVSGNVSFTLSRRMGLPEVVPEGNYLFHVNVSTREASLLLFAPVSIEKIIKEQGFEEHLSLLMSVLLVGFVSFVGFYYVFWLRRDLIKKKYEERQKNSVYPFPDFLTLPQSGYAYVGIVADAEEKAYLDHTQLNRHILIAGGTGSGKTVAGMVIAEELLKRNVPVVVFDPVGQWTGFARPNGEERMRKRFKKFGLGLPRAFNPRVIEITDATMNLDISHYLFVRGITVFRLDRLTPKKVDAFIEGALIQIYRADLPESGDLKSLVVLDEVHRLLPKYGGKRAYTKLEQAVREFRKWGLGLLMISQVLTDFKGAIRGNIGTEIQVHTRYEGDIKRVRERHGATISNLISKLPTGLGMVECANYNKGNPYFIEFRPLLHSPYKLTDKEVKTLVKKETPVLRMDAMVSVRGVAGSSSTSRSSHNTHFSSRKKHKRR